MDVTWEYLHLVANPFPVVLAAVGVMVGLVGWAADRDELERYGVLSLCLAGVAAIPAYFTGLSAADVAGSRTFVEPSLMQTHRSWATWTTVALVAEGVFAAFSLLQPEDRRLRRFVLLLGVGAVALLGYAAYLGGRITHGRETDVGESAGSAAPAARAAPVAHGAEGPGSRAAPGAQTAVAAHRATGPVLRAIPAAPAAAGTSRAAGAAPRSGAAGALTGVAHARTPSRSERETSSTTNPTDAGGPPR